MIDKRLLAEARQAKFHMMLSIGFGLGIGITAILQAGIFARIVNRVFLEQYQQGNSWFLLYTLLGIFLLRAIFSYCAERAGQRAAMIIKTELRKQMLQHIARLGPHYIRNERTGELTTILTEGIDTLDGYFSRYLPQLALAALIPFAIVAVIFPVDTISGIILIGTAPLVPLFMVLIGKWSESISQQQWFSLSRMSAHFLDTIQGLTTLKLFGQSRQYAETVRLVSEHFRDTTLGVLKVAFLSALVLELLTTLSTAIIAVAVGLRLLYGHMIFEPAFFVLLLTPEFYLPLRLLGTHFHTGMSAVSAANRIFVVLAEPIPHHEGQMLPTYNGGQRGVGVELVHVHFNYGTRQALQDINITIDAGERIALVGASGAGKSTLANLLLGFIRATSGVIKVNGEDIITFDAVAWRNHVSYIPQHPYLFAGTITDNIRMGNVHATVEEIMRAAVRAGAHAWIIRLPRGYDTLIGEGGVGISGGQQQMLAIARAFLKNAPLLILDEPTGGLDPEHEQQILASLDVLSQTCTTIFIAHRMNCVTRANRIIVLANGAVDAIGSHEELLQQQGLYQKLFLAFRGVL